MYFAKTALITGITGQDGYHLAKLLLKKNYRIIGLQQWSATDNTQNISELTEQSNFILRYGDMGDSASLVRLLQEFQPGEIYNLAAMSHVGASFEMPELTADTNALGTLRLLEAIRLSGISGSCRYYQASSSELFGNAPPPQNEHTPFQPCSPYGAAKLYGYWITVNYRNAYGIHASNGILFNHESCIRGEHFVTRKITKAIASIVAGEQDILLLGNLDAKRDWGHSADYVEGMWLMLQHNSPGDYVLATGIAHSVREFAGAAFACAGINLRWEGEGMQERGINSATGRPLIAVDRDLYRPEEVNFLLGDASRARKILDWRPKRSFSDLVKEMVLSDLNESSKTGNISCMMAS
jgi:GDPmannose 4,6-dehydratase